MSINTKNINNIFYIFVTAHLIFWTLIPSLTNHNLPLDTIEAIAWGSNLDWGFNKHPPMSAFFPEIFYQILDDETTNEMPINIIEESKKNFEERLENLNWDTYHKDLPFNPSALSLYKWAPIAEELKTLDRQIVLNSVILKWNVVKKEFKERVKF